MFVSLALLSIICDYNPIIVSWVTSRTSALSINMLRQEQREKNK